MLENSNKDHDNFQQIPSIEGDFSLESFYETSLGLRTHIVDGEKMYELEVPFSNNEYYQITKEEYESRIADALARAKEMYEDQKKAKEHNEKLKSIGFTQSSISSFTIMGYQNRLLTLLQDQDIKTIGAIPAYLETKKNTEMQLYQSIHGVEKKEKSQDVYEKQIVQFLEENEEKVEKMFLDEDIFMHIEQLFAIGYIQDLSLFYRFETLKKKNKINYYKRIYKYGSPFGLLCTDIPPESTCITNEDLNYIQHFITFGEGEISDLTEHKEEFIEKIKRSYVFGVKQYLGGVISRFGGKSSAFQKSKFEEYFGIGESECDALFLQAQKEFSNDFLHYIGDFNRETLPYDYKEKDHYAIVNIYEIKNILDRLHNSNDKHITNADVEELKKIATEKLTSLIQQGIQKIKDKEKPNIEDVKDWYSRRDASYKHHLQFLCTRIDDFYKIVNQLDPAKAKATLREENKEVYIKEYYSFFSSQFIKKKSEDLSDLDHEDEHVLKEKIIQAVKFKFLDLCKSKLSKYSTYDLNTKLKSHATIRLIIDAFFRTGYALLLKQKYPDDKQRTAFRQSCIQEISKQLAQEIEIRLSTIDTFSIQEYVLQQSIYGLYKKYGGTEDISKGKHPSTHPIEKNYIQYFCDSIQQEGEEKITFLEKKLAPKKGIQNIKIHDLYGKLVGYSFFIQASLSALIAKIDPKFEIKSYIGKDGQEEKKRFLEKNNTYNSIKNTVYPVGMIEDIGFFGYEIEKLELLLPDSLVQDMIIQYKRLDLIRDQIITLMIQVRGAKSGQADGKIQRACQEAFSLEITDSGTEGKDKHTFVIEYLRENLANFMFEDVTFEKISLYWRDKDMIKVRMKEFVEEVLNIQKQKNGQVFSVTYPAKQIAETAK